MYYENENKESCLAFFVGITGIGWFLLRQLKR